MTSVSETNLLALLREIIDRGRKAPLIDELEKRLHNDHALCRYLAAYRSGHSSAPATTNSRPAPSEVPRTADIVDPAIEQMLASGWDFRTREKGPVEVRGFLDSVRGLSEVVMTPPQCNMWRAILSAYRAWVRERRESAT